MADLSSFDAAGICFLLLSDNTERGYMRAEFHRKEAEVRAKECVIEKVIRLPGEEYAAFTQRLLKDYDFIEQNRELMGEKGSVWHCLLVTGEGVEEGVLVQSEGASYARYSSFVPSVSAMIGQENGMECREEMKKQTEGMCQQMA